MKLGNKLLSRILGQYKHVKTSNLLIEGDEWCRCLYRKRDMYPLFEIRPKNPPVDVWYSQNYFPSNSPWTRAEMLIHRRAV